MSTTPDLSNGTGLSSRQKRVMPSRSRRGGPGVGGTDVDMMILDTQKRKTENEPLIPSDTKFLLTTNSSFIPSMSSSSSTPFELELNNHAYERYFDRPEVLESYKTQQNIQTPEFSNLSEEASVGGRFRPRIQEEDIADTSDAAYEKRHRKYETFEKRQRLREKEKLKHEQYKLKERMDQLRAMDGSAFMTLPADSFSIVSKVPSPQEEESHPNGSTTYHEGERRRQEMLDVAAELEERYRVLLPPERRHLDRAERKLNANLESEGDALLNDDGKVEVDIEEVAVAVSNKQTDKIKLKLKFSREPSLAPAKVLADDSAMSSKKKKGSLLPLPNPVKMPATGRRSKSLANPRLSPPYISHHNSFQVDRFADNPVPIVAPGDETEDDEFVPSKPRNRSHKRRKASQELDDVGVDSSHSHVNGDHNPKPLRSTSHTHILASISAVSRLKRSHHARSHSARSSPKPSASTVVVEKVPGYLMVAAQRASGDPNARKSERRLIAFGTQLPEGLENAIEFVIPAWLHTEEAEPVMEGGKAGPEEEHDDEQEWASADDKGRY